MFGQRVGWNLPAASLVGSVRGRDALATAGGTPALLMGCYFATAKAAMNNTLNATA
jgi:hypothetical protein